MLLYGLRDLFDNPQAFAAILGAILVSYILGIAFHEFCHAWAAFKLGDPTAKNQGRLTLDPTAHIDPTGFLLLVLVGFGWGRPTPVNPYRLKNGPTRGNMLVALAGPVSNLAFALVIGAIIRFNIVPTGFDEDSLATVSGGEVITLFLFQIVSTNITLLIFNLIPIPPLDGFKVLLGIVPTTVSRDLQRLEPYGPGILMVSLAVSFIAPSLSPIYWVLGPLHSALARLIL